ncbi:MAG: hypothetical protein ACOYN3_01190 [Acidimicrobiia bacterium]
MFIDNGSLTKFLDAWALHVVYAPREHLPNRLPTDATIAFATDWSRAMLGHKHSRRTARALMPLIDARESRETSVLRAYELHVLIAIAATDLLERDQIAAFLATYRESGLDLWYRPVSVTRLRAVLHTVLEPYPSAKRLRLLSSLVENTDLELIGCIPRSTHFAPAFVAHYMRHGRAPIRRQVIAHAGLSEAMQHACARDQDVCVRHGIAECPDLFPSAQSLVAHDSQSRVRIALARNECLEFVVQLELARDSDAAVRVALSGNRAITASTMRFLAADSVTDVRYALARNPHLPGDVQLQLANDDDSMVLAALAGNIGLTAPAAVMLVKGDTPRVHAQLARNVRFPAECHLPLAMRSGLLTHAVLARRSDLCEDARAYLIEHSEARTLIPSRVSTECLATRETSSIAALEDHGVWQGRAHHARYERALDSSNGEDVRALEHPIVHRLQLAYFAITHGYAPARDHVKDSASLPGVDDVPFPSADEAQRRLHAVGAMVHVFRNGRELKANGRAMANCFVGERYAIACRAGTTIVAKFEHDGTPYNVGWEFVVDSWVLIGVEAPNIVCDVPNAVTEHVHDLGLVLEGLLPIRTVGHAPRAAALSCAMPIVAR